MMKRKWIAIGLAVTLIGTFITGCGNGSGGQGNSDTADSIEASGAESEEDYYEATILYHAGNDAASGLQAVEDRFNELTMEQLHMKVDLIPITYGAYDQQVQLMLSGGEPLDIFVMHPENASTFVEAGYMVDLTDYLSEEKTPNILSYLTMEEIKCCSIGDFIWGIPVIMERPHPNSFIMRNDILEEVGVNAEDIKSLDDMTEVYAKVHEAYPDMTLLSGQYNRSMPISSMHTDFLGDIYRIAVLADNGQTPKVVNYFETEEFATLVGHMRDWYEAGYVSKDFATCQDTGEVLMKAGNLFSFTTNTKPDSKKEKDVMTGYDTAIFQYNEPLLTTWGTSTVAYGIASNAKDPAKAVELYDWIMSNREANDLLNWGVEGVDWIETEDGTAAFPEGIDIHNVGYHQDYGWALPNQQNSHVWEGNDPSIFDEYVKIKNESKESVAYGFTFDGRGVTDEVTACHAVVEQYAYTLCVGAVDPEAGIKQLNEELYKAGLQTVLDEVQSQLDSYLAEK